MKQLIPLFFFSFGFCLTANAQITITATDIAPTGVVAQQTIDENPDPSILEGGDGNINWDFSALAVGTATTFVFLEPDQTPFAGSFPDANLTSVVDNSLYAYMIMDDQKAEIIGIEGELNYLGQAIQGKLEFSPGQSLIRFPATYQDAYDETITQTAQVTGSDVGFPAFDSVRLITTVVRMIEIDAYGIMTIPTGPYETIRSSETETTSNEVYVLSGGNWSLLQTTPAETVINFNWWTKDNGNGFPVVQLKLSPSSGNREVKWLQEFVTSTHETQMFDFSIFPNPASEYMKIDFPTEFTGTIHLVDMQGRSLDAISSNNSFTESMNVSSHTKGSYVLLLIDSEGRLVGTKKINLQ